ncbi:MAG: hypothetical protein JW726_12835, partial [Anaerolineales bacterium]|nr:hypothetical protein [Anaerolineales bacterium]
PLPPNGQYLVVWRNDGMFSGSYIFGQRIAGDGTPEVTGFILLSATGNDTFPAVAGSQQQYLVTYKSESLPPDPPSEPIVVVPVGPSTTDHYVQGVGGIHTLSSAVVSGPGGDMLIAFDEYASGEADILGVLWGNRTYMPLVVK